jgi:biopolymer transport protein ExbB
MKKIVTILTISGVLFFGATQSTFAQAAESVESETFHQVLKQRFIEGGPFFMGIVLVALILGLALA